MAKQWENRFRALTHQFQPQPSRPIPPLERSNRNKFNNSTSQIPQESTKTKTYFKILQAVHHAEILADNAKRDIFPKGLRKQVEKLSSAIKPSSPNNITTDRIKANTTEWMSNNMRILREHYDEFLAAELATTGPFDEESFNKSVNWAKNRYRNRLTHSSIETCRNLLQRSPPNSTSAEVSVLSPSDFPPLPPPAVPHGLDAAYPLDAPHAAYAEEDPPLSPELSIAPPNPPLLDVHTAASPLPQRRTVRALVHLTRVSAPPSEPQLTDNANLPVPNDDINNTSTILTIPPINFNLSLEDSHTEENGNTYLPDPPAISNVAIITDDLISSNTSRVETPPLLSPPGARTAAFNLGLPSDVSPRHVPTNELRSRSPGNSDSNQPDSTFKSVTTGAPAVKTKNTERTEPRIHPRTSRKMVDWSLKIRKTSIIIGDSNLGRLTPFTDAKLQIDSFPGATCHHIASLIKKVSLQPQVEMVILAVGLNNCLREQEQTTTWKQLCQMMAAAASVFPRASIFVPLIQYSNQLPQNQRMAIHNLNLKICNKFRFLNKLDQTLFATEPHDPVHWTRDTADLMVDNWLKQLN